MDPFIQFNDLPQIPNSLEDEASFAGWQYQYQYLAQPQAYIQARVESGECFGKGPPYHYPRTSKMESIQRYINNADTSPTSLYLGCVASLPLQTQNLKQYDQTSTWSSVEYVPCSTRIDSPEPTSVSGESTHYPFTDAGSPDTYYQGSYGGPTDSYLSGISYPSPNPSISAPGILELSHTGLGICPQDVLYEQDRVDPLAKDQVQDCSDTISESEPALDSQYASATPTDGERDEDGQHEYDIAMSYQLEEYVRPAEETDSDYSPVQRTSKKRCSSASNGPFRSVKRRPRKSGITQSAISKPNKNKRKRASVSSKSAKSSAKKNADSKQPFPCTLAIYGCQSKFSSKNEWKRHMNTQHIKLGFWRCDLCITTTDPEDAGSVYHNDFNRKDLFRQHLRRMHTTHPKGTSGGSDIPVTEANIVEHEHRCYRHLRENPQHSNCLFCDAVFTGANSWDDRMDHVGRHLEKDRRPETYDVSAWKVDPMLESYLLDEGLIKRNHDGWSIGNGLPRAAASRFDDDSGSE
ncbi:hypothetical protein BU24DRAFT_65786 [Aaosphaeria arxii CBS 175.79]|uniref:C2H2-type domain-containing protein n=1 Tax=Aaosphaeria arxii CBS 175.79 TaxID=1450172 RepID=A0A6A5XA76_9PLEO|nr:uncharacterized protein BU24DRAFT_65786 [Aaosphaeria arxii CBS 175.79]KAF2009851.1 hypothetical protein BU24DRAFT_65786 [Aaosphaeria arxii CBS 175.79]